jgi:hypothetical protein
MTCVHVLGVIDAGPFADCRRDQRDAAWRHARGCPACGPALAAAGMLETDLAALPQPGPPRDLARGVLARIEQVEACAVPTSPQRAQAFDAGEVARIAAAAAPAVAAALIGAATLASGSGGPGELLSPTAGGLAPRLATWPATAAGALTLAAGFALYVTLLAPLGGRPRRT